MCRHPQAKRHEPENHEGTVFVAQLMVKTEYGVRMEWRMYQPYAIASTRLATMNERKERAERAAV